MIDSRLSTFDSRPTFKSNFRLFRLSTFGRLFDSVDFGDSPHVGGSPLLFPVRSGRRTLSRDRRIGTRSNDTARRSHSPCMAFLRFGGIIVPLYYKIVSRAFLEPLRARQNIAAILQAAKIKPRFSRGCGWLWSKMI